MIGVLYRMRPSMRFRRAAPIAHPRPCTLSRSTRCIGRRFLRRTVIGDSSCNRPQPSQPDDGFHCEPLQEIDARLITDLLCLFQVCIRQSLGDRLGVPGAWATLLEWTPGLNICIRCIVINYDV